MAKKTGRVSENDVALATMRIAEGCADKIGRFRRLKRDIPSYLSLSAADRAPSLTRNGEELWEQQIRNIKSHHNAEGNAICEGRLEHVKRIGYRITKTGSSYLRRKGY